ncbi:transcription factor bHLH85-like [Panicum miliaceum]|uniref:Transcription factor bHLH85-like n=1 Tax=Panicum miliaceum TaxID=4540 RepID=A0A3L6TQD7_PANMI|nr:transcription factor bHLH85-like [Panicum miliaceum]
MSQAELAAWLESRDAHWCSQYPAAPLPDEESEIVAQFLAAPYPYQNDDEEEEQEQKHQHHKLGEISATSSMYWPEPGHVTDPGNGACYWPPDGAASNSNSSGSGAYFDGSCCCYYYLAEPDVSLGINTRTTMPCTSSIDLNLLGDGEEEGTASVAHPVPPNPSPADHTHTAGHRNGGGDGAAARAAVSLPKRKAQTGNDGGDLGRHRKKEKKAASKTAQKCSQESAQSKGSCSADESMSNCSEVNRRSGAHSGGGGNAKARAAKGSATDPQSLYARVDISTMLEEAVHYVRFLQQQIKMLSSDEMWMYAPIAYNGMSLGIDLKISTLQ